jgi:putative ATPase
VPDHPPHANRDAQAPGHGKDYEYPHLQPGQSTPQQYQPREIHGTYFTLPPDQGYEAQVGDRLEMWRAAQRKALGITETETIPDLSEENIQDIKRRHKPSGGQLK